MHRIPILLVILLIAIIIPKIVAQQPHDGRRTSALSQPAGPASDVRILKIGTLDVEGGRHAQIEDEAVDLIGSARNYRDFSLAALVHPRGQSRYFVAATSAAEQGNIFTLSGSTVSRPRL